MERLPARSTARSRISYVPGRTVLPLTRPNQTSLPSSCWNLLVHAPPTVDEHDGASALVDAVARRHSVAPAVAVGREHSRQDPDERDDRFGRVDAYRVRQDDRAAVAARAAPAADTRPPERRCPTSSRPSQVYETRVAVSWRLRTSVRTERPSESSMSTVTVSGRRSLNEMTATSRAHSHTGENTRSTRVPVTGLRSSFSRSVTANAAAVAPSRARTSRSWASRANARIYTGSRPDTRTNGSACSHPQLAP